MRVVPADGVKSTALVSGKMDLSAAGRDRFRCSPVGTALWVSLRHNDGFVDLAVQSLARVWEIDREKVGVVMNAWSRKMLHDGWLKVDP